MSENLFLRYFLQDQGIVFVNDTSRIPTPHRELNDTELGDLLGYSCNTHDYSNPDLELIDVTISFGDVHIYSEGCEKLKIEKEKLINDVTQKIDTWSKILDRYGMLSEKNKLQYTLREKVPGRILLDEKNWRNKEFVQNHLEQYSTHLEDVFVEDHNLDIIKYFEIFIVIMKKSFDKDFSNVLKEYTDYDMYKTRINDYQKR